MSVVPDPSFCLQATELLQQQQIEAALNLVSEGVRTYPAYIGGYIMLTRCYIHMGHGDAATVILDEVERRFPGRAVTVQERRSVAELQDVIQELAANTATSLESERAIEPETVDRSAGELSSDVVAYEMDSQVESSLAEMPEAGTDVGVETEPTMVSAPSSQPQAPFPLLRVIDLAVPLNDTRIIRSTSMRLIPGLEYTSLRFEGAKHRGRRSIQPLPEPPAYRQFHPSRSSPATTTRVAAKPSLENLAERISKVRITAEDLNQRPPAPAPAPSPSRPLYTETLTRIYMQQERWAEAIEGWEALMAKNPEHRDRYQGYIAECLLRKGTS